MIRCSYLSSIEGSGEFSFTVSYNKILFPLNKTNDASNWVMARSIIDTIIESKTELSSMSS